MSELTHSYSVLKVYAQQRRAEDARRREEEALLHEVLRVEVPWSRSGLGVRMRDEGRYPLNRPVVALDIDADSGDITLLNEASGETKEDVTLVKDPEDPANFDEIGKDGREAEGKEHF